MAAEVQLTEPFGLLGRRSLETLGAFGRSAVFLARTFSWAMRPPYRVRLVIEHMQFIGNRSLSVIALTGVFTGMVLALGLYKALVRFGGEVFLGPAIAIILIRELGPVLGSLMVAARAGSAMAATVAGMRVTEQIDALDVMAVEPVQYLASTRMIASLLTVPVLVTLFNLIGLGASLAYSVGVLGVDWGIFMTSVREAVEPWDIAISLYKALLFAVFIAWISTFKGYYAARGALGIGRATTEAVVVIAVLFLAGNFVMDALLL
jgi:phospholipid/cholesterol/gamma-HCH transport system permease protein